MLFNVWFCEHEFAVYVISIKVNKLSSAYVHNFDGRPDAAGNMPCAEAAAAAPSVLQLMAPGAWAMDFLHSAHNADPAISKTFCKNLPKLWQKLDFADFFWRVGNTRRSRATWRQNFKLLRRLATTKTSKNDMIENLKTSVFWAIIFQRRQAKTTFFGFENNEKPSKQQKAKAKYQEQETLQQSKSEFF